MVWKIGHSIKDIGSKKTEVTPFHDQGEAAKCIADLDELWASASPVSPP